MQLSSLSPVRPRVTLVLLSFVLTACGGGGGSDGGGSQTSLSLDQNSLTFSTNDPTRSPSAQQIRATISPPATQTIYLRIVIGGEIPLQVSNIRIISAASGTADISIPTAVTESLGPGQYTGTIRVTACTSSPQCASGLIGTTQTANVTYTISGVTASASQMDFTVTDSSVSADYSQQLAIRAYPSYTASVDATWLAIDPVSGADGDSSVTVNLDNNDIDSGTSGLRTANLTFSADGANSLTVPVNVTVQKPQLDQVAPYVARSGVADTVVIRGQFLDQLGSTQIDFAPDLASAGTLATDVQFVSATELRVSHPALPAGRYLVRMYDDTGAVRDRSQAHLVVVDDPAFPAAYLTYPNGEVIFPIDVVYDAERQALLISAYRRVDGLTLDDNVVMRFTYNGGWNTPDVVNVFRAAAMALSTDGEDLLVGSEAPSSTSSFFQAQVVIFSPDLSELRRTFDSEETREEYTDVVVTSDNRALLVVDSQATSGFRPVDIHDYSFDTNAFTENKTSMRSFEDGSRIAASGDGQRVFISSPPSSSAEYDVPNDILTRLGVNSDAAMLDRSGDVLVSRSRTFTGTTAFIYTVYDRNWNVLGQVTSDRFEFALSPDGARLYTYSNTPMIRSYDLTATPVDGEYPEIGSGIALAGDPGAVFFMTVTPDGNTILVIGSDGIAVQPLN